MNGNEKDFYLINHASLITDQHENCSYPWRTSDESTFVLKSDFCVYILSDFGQFENENYANTFYESFEPLARKENVILWFE